MSLFVTCIDDQQEERYGFLLLKKRKVKRENLTKGNTYKVEKVHSSTYGNLYVNHTFVYYLILDDRGVPQLFPEEIFDLQVA